MGWLLLGMLSGAAQPYAGGRGDGWDAAFWKPPSAMAPTESAPPLKCRMDGQHLIIQGMEVTLRGIQWVGIRGADGRTVWESRSIAGGRELGSFRLPRRLPAGAYWVMLHTDGQPFAVCRLILAP